MSFKYEPRGSWGRPADPKLCPASVTTKWDTKQCQRKRGVHAEGWCKTHDPEMQKAKRDESHKRWMERREEEQRRDILNGLARATVEQLKAELKRRKKGGP